MPAGCLDRRAVCADLAVELLVRVDRDANVDTLVDEQLIVFTEMAVKFVHEQFLGDPVASLGEFVVDGAGLALTGGCF